MPTEVFPKVLNTYLESAMARAKYKLLDDGNWWGEIPECPGTNAYQPTLEECKRELLEALEGWIIIALEDGDELPIIDGIDLNGEIECLRNELFVPAGEEILLPSQEGLVFLNHALAANISI